MTIILCSTAIALLAALDLLLFASGARFQLGQYVLVCAFVFSVPGAAYIFFALIDPRCPKARVGSEFGGFAALLSLAILFKSNEFTAHLESTILSVWHMPIGDRILFFSKIISNAAWCGGLAALVVLAICATLEAAAMWVLEGKRRYVSIPFPALRLLLSIVIIALLFNRIVDMYTKRLYAGIGSMSQVTAAVAEKGGG